MTSRSTQYASSVKKEQCVRILIYPAQFLNIFSSRYFSSFLYPWHKIWALWYDVIILPQNTPNWTSHCLIDQSITRTVPVRCIPNIWFKRLCLLNRLDFIAKQFFVWTNLISICIRGNWRYLFICYLTLIKQKLLPARRTSNLSMKEKACY